jgi:hypothetical protein
MTVPLKSPVPLKYGLRATYITKVQIAAQKRTQARKQVCNTEAKK